MGLTVTITDAGRAALRNAAGNGTNAVTVAAVGLSSQAFTPGAAIPAEIKQLTTISGGATAADTIHVTVLDSGSDDYSVYGFALYLSDGTLFASYGQSTVIVEKSAQAMMQLAFDIRFVDVAASSISFGDANFVNPAATEDTLGVVMLAKGDEVAAGTDVQKALTPATFKSGLDARFGSGAPSSFFKGLMTSASAAALRLALAIKGAALYDTGSGNGLDADLLDGEQGAYYLDYGNLKNVPASQGIAYITGLQAALDAKLGLHATADTAAQLASAFNLTLSGPVTGMVSMDGSKNVTLNTAIADGGLSPQKTAGLVDALTARLLCNYGVGTGMFSGKSLVQGANGPAFCYAGANGDVWVSLATQAMLGNYLPLSGGTLSGPLTVPAGTAVRIPSGDSFGLDAGNVFSVKDSSGAQQLAFAFGVMTKGAVPIGLIQGLSSKSITNGTKMTFGGFALQAFFIASISGPGARVTFPDAFAALPTVIITPTAEAGTNKAIAANIVINSLDNTGFNVNINGDWGAASYNGCGLWVWAFGAT